MIGKKFVDLTGKQFGRWKVLKRSEDIIDKKTNKHSTYWLCECSCDKHTIRTVKGTALVKGRSKSCGCLSLENSKNNTGRPKVYNTYDLSGKYGIGYTLKEEPFYFDLEDYDKIKLYTWHLNSEGYLSANGGKELGYIKLSRIIMDAKDNEKVDHIYHNLNDNRKINLRKCSNQENSYNHVIHKNNTSGVSGISWDKEFCKWRARIWVEGKCIHLGRFSSFENAVNIRKQAEIQYFKEYRYIENNNTTEGVTNK